MVIVLEWQCVAQNIQIGNGGEWVKAMEYKFTIVFGELRDFEQANEYIDKLTEFIDKELTEEWCAFGERVENDGEVH